MRIKERRTSRGRVAAGVAALLSAVAMLGGCPGTLDNKELFMGGGTFECPDVPKLFETTCTNGGCHGVVSPAAMLDLKSPDLKSRLAEQPSTFCTGGVLASSIDPGSSVIYRKLTDAVPCGAKMPLGLPALSEDELECVLDWIATLAAEPSAGAGADDAAAASD